MNKKYIRLFSIILVTIISFFINIKHTKAITCYYEMYAIGVGTTNGETVIREKKDMTNIASIKYTSKDFLDFSIESYSNFGRGEKNPSFSKTAINTYFSQYIKTAKACPYYIHRTGNNSIEKISEKDFMKEMKTFYNETSEYKYPLFLVSMEKDGETKTITEPAEKVLSYATEAWKEIINKNVSSSSDISQYLSTTPESAFEYSVKRSTISSTILSSSLWSEYQKFIDDKKQIYQINNQLSGMATNYCKDYCEWMVCEQYTEQTAKNQCMKSCESTQKIKCNQAYNSCRNVPTNEQDTCIKSKLRQNGLDESYVDRRKQKVSDLQQKKLNLVQLTQPESLLLNHKKYTLKCEDVSLLHTAWMILWIGAPILVIVLSTFEYFRAVIASDMEKADKLRKKLPKRLLILGIFILIPTLVTVIVSISIDENARDSSLMYCVVNGGGN